MRSEERVVGQCSWLLERGVRFFVKKWLMSKCLCFYFIVYKLVGKVSTFWSDVLSFSTFCLAWEIRSFAFEICCSIDLFRMLGVSFL